MVTITNQRQVVAFIAYFAPVNRKSFCKAGNKRQERETPHRKKSKNFIPYQL